MTAFEERRALKVISGLRNFDEASVAAVVRAANSGGATHVDIACSAELVKLARSITDLPVCVSAVDAELFLAAIKAGADMVEIGNYDGFYAEGRKFSAEEVLRITERTKSIIGSSVPLSVTVPHTLPLDEQVSLALELQQAGANIIQTEGGMPMRPSAGGIQGLIEKASPTLAATAAISHAVDIPTMAASGISHVTAPLALAAGASGVGVGSAVNKLNSPVAMIAAVRQIHEAMANENQRVRSRK
jgi:thiamine monophosphate synthase